MSGIFGRKYKIVIGRNQKLLENTVSKADEPYLVKKVKVSNSDKIDSSYRPTGVLSTEYVDMASVPSGSITFTEHHVDVRVSNNKNVDTAGSPQEAVIQIYNIAQDILDFLSSGSSVVVYGGWEKDGDNLPLLYAGQINFVITTRRDANLVTEIYSTPSKIANETLVYKSYPPNTKLGEVLEDLASMASDKGLPKGAIFSDPILEREYYNGYTVRGNLLDCISKTCDENHIRSYISNGQIFMEPKDTTNYVGVVRVDESEIKGTVDVEMDKSLTQDTVGAIGPTGIRLRIFLNGAITTSTLVEFLPESQYLLGFAGSYTVVSVDHELSYEGDVWDTVLHCERYGTTST